MKGHENVSGDRPVQFFACGGDFMEHTGDEIDTFNVCSLMCLISYKTWLP